MIIGHVSIVHVQEQVHARAVFQKLPEVTGVVVRLGEALHFDELPGCRAIPDVAGIHLTVQGDVEPPNDGHRAPANDGVFALARRRSGVNYLGLIELPFEVQAPVTSNVRWRRLWKTADAMIAL